MSQADEVRGSESVSTDTTLRLLAELARQRHPSAVELLESWTVDLFVSGRVPAAEAEALAAAYGFNLRASLQRRNLSYRLDGGPDGDNGPTFSIVLPVFNEEENIAELYQRLSKVMEGVGEYELVFVNNCSTDRTRDLIRELRARDDRVKLITFSRNFGQQASITAGLDHSRGRAVMIMDSDLQDPPELLPEMIEKWRQGYKVVYAVRKRRKEGKLIRLGYFGFYRVMRAIADIDIPLDSGDFCLMDRTVVEQLKRMPERTRFLRGLRRWVGHSQIALEYERLARRAGRSSYSLARLVALAVDGITSFSSLPLRLASYLGVLTSFAGLVYLAYAVFMHFLGGGVPQGWTSIVALVLLVGGAQLVLLGVLGEYVARVYDESKRRPPYIVSEILE